MLLSFPLWPGHVVFLCSGTYSLPGQYSHFTFYLFYSSHCYISLVHEVFVFKWGARVRGVHCYLMLYWGRTGLQCIKTFNFHKTIIAISIKHFPEKTIKIFNLDKMLKTPYLKNLLRKIKSNFYRNRKSPKWMQTKKELKVKKIVAVRHFHSKFVTGLKSTNPSKFYQMCKKIGTGDQITNKELKVECSKGRSDGECGKAVGQGLASVSSQFQPLNKSKKSLHSQFIFQTS